MSSMSCQQLIKSKEGLEELQFTAGQSEVQVTIWVLQLVSAGRAVL